MDASRTWRAASRVAYVLAALAAVRMFLLNRSIERPAGEAQPITPGTEVASGFRAWTQVRYWLVVETDLDGPPSWERRRDDPPAPHMVVDWTLTENGAPLVSGTDSIASDGGGDYVRLATIRPRVGRRYDFRARAHGDPVGGRTAVAVRPVPKADMGFLVVALLQITGFTILGRILSRQSRRPASRR